MIRSFRYKFSIVILVVFFLFAGRQSTYGQQGINDTITSFAVIYLGDTIEAKTLMDFSLYSRYNRSQMYERAKWTRLRNAIYVTFPYAKRAGRVMNDINAHLAVISSKEERKKYIKTREKELKKEFTDPLTNLSIYQGKVLMKLINRETGNNCYEIIKEYKGGFTARFYQTVAFFFTTNLKQPYDIQGEDQEMEKIVLEVARMYGPFGG
ncbi:hypothetical protein BH11BAC3_BH11BAC3_17720 [soil metagenome]